MSDSKGDIRSLYGRISEHFSSAEVEKLQHCFHFPLLITSAEGVQMIPDAAAFRVSFGAMLDGLHAQGFTHSKIERQQLRSFNPSCALTSVLWVRYRGEDVLERLGATYTLTHSEGSWRVTAIIAHSPEDLLALE